MLVTLLVLWVVVIPALTVAGTYFLSGALGRRLRARHERLAELELELGTGDIPMTRGPGRHLRARRRSHAQRTRDHALVGR